MIAFWWEDWPGTLLRAGWSGLTDTALIVVGGVALTMLGQVVVGGLDLRGTFDPAAGAADSPTFPATMPLAGAAFVAMLQLTLVCEGWPLRGLPPSRRAPPRWPSSWVVALGLYARGRRPGRAAGPDRRLAGVVLRRVAGMAVLSDRPPLVRLVAANVAVIGGGCSPTP